MSRKQHPWNLPNFRISRIFLWGTSICNNYPSPFSGCLLSKQACYELALNAGCSSPGFWMFPSLSICTLHLPPGYLLFPIMKLLQSGSSLFWLLLYAFHTAASGWHKHGQLCSPCSLPLPALYIDFLLTLFCFEKKLIYHFSRYVDRGRCGESGSWGKGGYEYQYNLELYLWTILNLLKSN